MKILINKIVYLIFSLLIFSSCNQNSKSSVVEKNDNNLNLEELSIIYPGDFWQIAKPNEVGFSNEKIKALDEEFIKMNTTGFMLIVKGRVIYEFGDIAKVSYLASVRKSILAMLYGKYVDSGAIDLTKTLSDLGMSDIGGLLPIEKKASVWDLITARSGVYHPASNSGDNLADAPERGSKEPGTYYLYSNWDFNASGGAFELLSGVNIFDALKTDIMDKIKAQDFDRSIHKKGGDTTISIYPSYHMHLSTRDMARVGHLMLTKGEWANNKQIISANWIDQITSLVTPKNEMNPNWRKEEEFGYGVMWWIFDHPDLPIELNGAYTAKGAYGQYITVLPELDMVISHKTAVPPNKKTKWSEVRSIIDLILEARK